MARRRSLARVVSPFRREDFPDLRLRRRAQATMDMLARRAQHGLASTPALRRGAARFYDNTRLDARRLLARSTRVTCEALRDAPVVLACEDSMYVRGHAPDAGPLTHGSDVGYVTHHAFAVLPGAGRPCAWLGGLVWTRRGTYRAQDHKTRPPCERESAKWSRLRRRLVTRLRNAGVRGRIVSLDDREGDNWSSLSDAARRRDELITRATQDRLLASGKRLRATVRRGHDAGTPSLTLHVRAPATGRASTRVARVRVRWARVVLPPPRRDPFVRDEAPIELVALQVREERPPRRARRLESWLLTTCPVADARDALQVVAWYGERWGVEVGNDVLKNALEVEDAVRKDVESFERALALAGPVAAQVAQWTALARAPSPPPAAAHLDGATCRAIEKAARYYGVPTPPAPWTMADVVATLGKIGGGDVRPKRPAGWRVTLRGWHRVEEFRRILSFARHDERMRRASRKRGPPEGE